MLGTFRFIVEIQHKISPLANDFLRYVATLNFLHYAVFLFVVCSAVLVLVSLMSPAPARAQLTNLTYATLDCAHKFQTKWNALNLGASVTLLAILLALWWTFR